MDQNRFRDFQLISKSLKSRVYSAFDVQLGRKVAIKSIALNHGVHPFEIEIHKNLNHSNILKLVDGFSDATSYHLVFPWLNNGTMDSRLSDQNWTIDERISVFQQLLQSVLFLHSRGIVHGDIKPQNCLFDDHGFVQLSDFGNARFNDINMNLKSEFVGSPGYMAPELIRQEMDVSIASDIYALGMVIFELLSKERALSEDPTAAIHMTLQNKRLQIDKSNWRHRSTVNDWNSVIATATHPQFNQRYPSVNDLIGDIRSIVDGRPIKLRPWGVSERFLSWAKREPRTVRWIFASLMILVFSFAAVILGWSRSNSRFRKMQESRLHYDHMANEFESKRLALQAVLARIRDNTQLAEQAELDAEIHDRDSAVKDIELSKTNNRSSDMRSTNELVLQEISAAKRNMESLSTHQNARQERERMVQSIASSKGRLENYFHTIKRVESLIERNDMETARRVISTTDSSCRGLEFEILEDVLSGDATTKIEYFGPVPGAAKTAGQSELPLFHDGIVPVLGSSMFILIDKKAPLSFHLIQWSKNPGHVQVDALKFRNEWTQYSLCRAYASKDGKGILLLLRNEQQEATFLNEGALVETRIEIADDVKPQWTVTREFRPKMRVSEVRYEAPGRVLCLGHDGRGCCIWSNSFEEPIWHSGGDITWYLSDLRPNSDFVFFRDVRGEPRTEIVWVRIGPDDAVQFCEKREIETLMSRSYPLTFTTPNPRRRNEFVVPISQSARDKFMTEDKRIRFDLSTSCADAVFLGFFPSFESENWRLRSNIDELNSNLWKNERATQSMSQCLVYLEQGGLAEPFSIFRNNLYRVSNKFQDTAERIMNRSSLTHEEFDLGMNRFLEFMADKVLAQLIEIEN